MKKLQQLAHLFNKAMAAATPTLGTVFMVLKIAHEWHAIASSCSV